MNGCGKLYHTGGSGKIVFQSDTSHESCMYDIRPFDAEGKKYYTILKFHGFSVNGAMPNCAKSDRVVVYIG